MPSSTVNGWTGANLLPSYAVTAQILGGAGGPASINSGAGRGGSGAVPVPTGNINNPTFSYGGGGGGGGGGIPNVPAVNPPGWGGGSQFAPAPGGRGGIVDPSLNPQQAYAQYLQLRGFADTATPQSQVFNQYQNVTGALTQADPFGFASNPATQAVGGIGNMQSGYNQNLALQQQMLARILPTTSSYAFSYGSPAANAPSPQPVNGYQQGYGQAPAPWWANAYGGGAAGPTAPTAPTFG
jgi:hypothetical protein